MLRAALLVVGVLSAATARAETPKVVVTVKPIHALVAGVMKGVGEPRLLAPPTASEHSFNLKPSDARALQDADLVFWVGAGLESFMAKPLETISRRARIVELSAAPGMTLLARREGGAWEDHAHGPAAAPDEADMHIWLDPDNAARIVAVAAEALATADPADARRYRENGRDLTARLEALDGELGAALAPVRSAPFIVFHDAYQYLERRYGLNAVGSVTVSPERRPSARRISSIRRKVVDLGAVCVFSELQFDAALVRTIAEGTPARTAALDPLGVDAPDGADGYFHVMRRLVHTIADCLAGSR
jgi:zinc transport system substrate-binding protein